jgi:uncharacterized protein (DUF2062 family)
LLNRHFLEPFSSVNPPWFDARGAAVGLAIGFGCPVGAQMVTLGLLRTVFKFNLPAAFAFTWVNNPLTVIPMYYAYYYFGSLCLGQPPLLTPEALKGLMHPILKMGYFWSAFHGFVSIGWEFLTRWSVMAALVAFVSATLGYFSVYRLQKGRCLRRAREIGMSYERLVEALENRVKAKTHR